MTLFLLARIADRTVAIPVDQVESVVDIGPIIPVPGAPAFVIGLAALRSKLMTVISSRTVLGAPIGTMTAKRAVVTVIDGHQYAILVNELEDAAEFDLKPLPPGLPISGAWRTVASGVVECAGEPLLAINLRALVPPAAMAA